MIVFPNYRMPKILQFRTHEQEHTYIGRFILIRRVSQTKLSIFTATPRKDRESVPLMGVQQVQHPGTRGAARGSLSHGTSRRNAFRVTFIVGGALSGHGLLLLVCVLLDDTW